MAPAAVLSRLLAALTTKLTHIHTSTFTTRSMWLCQCRCRRRVRMCTATWGTTATTRRTSHTMAAVRPTTAARNTTRNTTWAYRCTATRSSGSRRRRTPPTLPVTRVLIRTCGAHAQMAAVLTCNRPGPMQAVAQLRAAYTRQMRTRMWGAPRSAPHNRTRRSGSMCMRMRTGAHMCRSLRAYRRVPRGLVLVLARRVTRDLTSRHRRSEGVCVCVGT